MQTHEFSGVPDAIARDGWWLTGEDPEAAPPLRGRCARRGWGLMALIALADGLFWNHAVGVSLALFALAVFAVAAWPVRPRRALIRPGALLLASALPVVDYVQPLSLAFLTAGLMGALAWARLPGTDAAARLWAAARLLARWPWDGIASLGHGLRRMLSSAGPVEEARAGLLRAALRSWAFPLGGTLVFAALLIDANPLIAQILTPRLDGLALTQRLLFWSGTGLLLWPLLDPAPVASGRLQAKVPRLPKFGINAASTLRALVMFNLLIGLQTLLDLSILSGGADLPRGMTYAAYAHRGAYPLLATALLAGAFAMAARPFLGEHRLIRPLMLLWLAQNAALAASAALRLDLYVGVYGLTYLRVHALIWIGLVAAGLLVMVAQAALGRDNRWLLLRLSGMALATLYLCSFINFAGIIAARNLAAPVKDMDYVCTLGPTAAAEIALARIENPSLAAWWPVGCGATGPRIEGWRDWGFRNWRVARYLGPTPQMERRG